MLCRKQFTVSCLYRPIQGESRPLRTAVLPDQHVRVYFTIIIHYSLHNNPFLQCSLSVRICAEEIFISCVVLKLVWFHSNYSLYVWKVVGRGTERAHSVPGSLAVAGSKPAATMFSLSGRRTAVFSSTSLETAKENIFSKWHLALQHPEESFR